jgi:hypothetical protein
VTLRDVDGLEALEQLEEDDAGAVELHDVRGLAVADRELGGVVSDRRELEA